MNRSPLRAAFTLIEMITVIAIIVILVSLVLAINGLVQRKAAIARADAEIRMLGQGLEAYKTDFGGYPQDLSLTTPNATSSLDPTISPPLSPTTYIPACSVLYAALSGDTNANGVIDNGEIAQNYVPDFFKPTRLAGGASTGVPCYILDPYGNSYGYSTAGLLAEQQYQTALATNPSTAVMTKNANGNPVNALGFAGYNTTFDLWSSGGTTGSNGSPDTAKWIKNW